MMKRARKDFKVGLRKGKRRVRRRVMIWTPRLLVVTDVNGDEGHVRLVLMVLGQRTVKVCISKPVRGT